MGRGFADGGFGWDATSTESDRYPTEAAVVALTGVDPATHVHEASKPPTTAPPTTAPPTTGPPMTAPATTTPPPTSPAGERTDPARASASGGTGASTNGPGGEGGSSGGASSGGNAPTLPAAAFRVGRAWDPGGSP